MEKPKIPGNFLLKFPAPNAGAKKERSSAASLSNVPMKFVWLCGSTLLAVFLGLLRLRVADELGDGEFGYDQRGEIQDRP